MNRPVSKQLIHLFFAVLLMLSLLGMAGCGGSEYAEGDLPGMYEPLPAGEITLAWLPPTSNEDGSSILDLSGYRVHYGQQSGSYSRTVTVVSANSCCVGGLEVGRWFFAVTALDSSGNESELSNEVYADIQL